MESQMVSLTKIHIIIHVDYIICLTYMDCFILTKQKPIQKSILSLQNIHISYTPCMHLKNIQVSCKLRTSFSLDFHLQFLREEILSLEVSPVTSGETHVSWATKKNSYYFPLNPGLFYRDPYKYWFTIIPIWLGSIIFFQVISFRSFLGNVCSFLEILRSFVIANHRNLTYCGSAEAPKKNTHEGFGGL